MNLDTFYVFYLKTSLLQLLLKLIFSVEMVKPGDIEILLPPVDIDVTELTSPQNKLFKEIFVVLLLPP